MTVAELIAKLQDLPPDLPVLTAGEYGYDHIKGVQIAEVVYQPRGWSGDYWPKEDAIGDTREGEPLPSVILHWGDVL